MIHLLKIIKTKTMKKLLLFCVAFMFSAFAFSQNLVLNPSLESVNTSNLECSWYTSQAQFNSAISNWTCPTAGSTDIFHSSLATSCFCSPFSTNASSPAHRHPEPVAA